MQTRHSPLFLLGLTAILAASLLVQANAQDDPPLGEDLVRCRHCDDKGKMVCRSCEGKASSTRPAPNVTAEGDGPAASAISRMPKSPTKPDREKSPVDIAAVTENSASGTRDARNAAAAAPIPAPAAAARAIINAKPSCRQVFAQAVVSPARKPATPAMESAGFVVSPSPPGQSRERKTARVPGRGTKTRSIPVRWWKTSRSALIHWQPSGREKQRSIPGS